MPRDVYLGLMRSDGMEVQASEYIRQRVPRSLWKYDKLGKIYKTTEQILFPESTSIWGSVTAGAFFNASSGGVLLQHLRLSNRMDIYQATICTFGTGAIVIERPDLMRLYMNAKASASA